MKEICNLSDTSYKQSSNVKNRKIKYKKAEAATAADLKLFLLKYSCGAIKFPFCHSYGFI